MVDTNPIRLLATKYDCGAFGAYELAERLRSVADVIEVETLIAEERKAFQERTARRTAKSVA